jgi:hypothetical protein
MVAEAVVVVARGPTVVEVEAEAVARAVVVVAADPVAEFDPHELQRGRVEIDRPLYFCRLTPSCTQRTQLLDACSQRCFASRQRF